MNCSLQRVRGALVDLLNAIDDAYDDGLISDEGHDWLTDVEVEVEGWVKNLDKHSEADHDAA